MKWKWEGVVFVDSPIERRVVDKAEAETEIERLRRGIRAMSAEFGEAIADGCDANGASDCVSELAQELLGDKK